MKASAAHNASHANRADAASPSHSAARNDSRIGNRAMHALLRSGAIRARLEVGAVDDPLEREADQTADRVMRSPMEPAASCPACSGEDQVVRRSSEGGCGSVHKPSHVDRATLGLGVGVGLPSALRGFFEPRFGRDLGRVRIHTDGPAAAGARSIGARAYTLGNDIAFADGQFQPQTEGGRHLIAHELAHALQEGGAARAVRRAPAGGCADEGETWADDLEERRQAGLVAHDQIQLKYFPQLDIEAELPRATKDRLGAACPEKGRAAGKLDLWSSKGGSNVQIGEIKSVNSAKRGGDEVQHYLLRYSQMVERLTGGGCGEPVADQEDMEFASQWLWLSLLKGRLPTAGPLSSVVPGEPGEFVATYIRDPTKDLFCKLLPTGAVVYWCNKRKRRREDEDEDQKQPQLPKGDSRWDLLPKLLPAVFALGLPRNLPIPPGEPVIPPEPIRIPTTVPFEEPLPTTNVPAPYEIGEMPAPRFRLPGGTMPFLSILAVILMAHQASASIDEGKEKVKRLRGPYDAMWDEVEKALADMRKRGPATAQPGPPSSSDQPPVVSQPPDVRTKIRIFEVSGARLREREETVRAVDIGLSYVPVQFFSVTKAGEPTTIFDLNRVDCGRVKSGASAVAGIEYYIGFARARDTAKLESLLNTQMSIARLACFATGRSPPAASDPDGDGVSAKLSTSRGSVSSACWKLQGEASWNCTSEGNFKSMRAVMDDPTVEPEFILELTVTRTRGGTSEPFDSTLSVWIDDPDHPEPEPDVQIDGEVPAEAIHRGGFPNDMAYLLGLYGRWSGR